MHDSRSLKEIIVKWIFVTLEKGLMEPHQKASFWAEYPPFDLALSIHKARCISFEQKRVDLKLGSALTLTINHYQPNSFYVRRIDSGNALIP